MRTPGHAVLNLALLGPSAPGAVLAGAILPDLPIAILYLRERLRGTPEEEIWAVHYQRRSWQDFIHGAHSIPLSLAGALLALALSAQSLALFFASTLLHAVADFPVHVQDAHRHLFPLSDYRFISPLSYWDERFYGRQVTQVELLLVFAAGAALWMRGLGSPGALALLGVLVWYPATYWLTFVRRR
jgi:hypothetical protein